MKTRLSIKRGLAIFFVALALARPIWAPMGMNLAARMAHGSTAPRAVAVNWNSNAMVGQIFE